MSSTSTMMMAAKKQNYSINKLNNKNKINNKNILPIDFYDELFDSIVKIYSTHNRVPNYSTVCHGNNNNHLCTSTRSGFVIYD
mmetsp:Transcript_24649/g.24961  ORF Transcript_24649/g.24961 Transcript_24649/m.24961 type:complete len:83 (-) Transcript_24649:353-601(-)